GESRVLAMHLVRSCLGVDCGSASLTCTEDGCRPRVAGELPEWSGRPPRLDGGTRDASIRDTGGADAPPIAAAPLHAGREPPVGCDGRGEADAGLGCTTGTCEGGVCRNAPSDVACDDGNPCTDDRCVPGTGCAPAFNTAPCGETTCGDYGPCDYADGCDEAAT